jgi:membrane protein DedA with SNARE-associated domain
LFEDLLTTYGYLGVFAVSLAVNLLPFTSPSNMILAGAAAFLVPTMDPILVGLAVAIAASLAKTVHYYVASYVGAKTGSKSEKLGSYGRRLGRWGALAAFVVAATPIPDDPVVIPLGMTRYSPAKFFIAYLMGKTLVSVLGAYLGRQSALTFQAVLPSNEYIVVTAVVSVLIASILVKAGLPAWASRLKRALDGLRSKKPQPAN